MFDFRPANIRIHYMLLSPRKCCAFTLIEIVAAVAITAVISAIAISALSSSKSDSQEKRKSAIISSIEQAKNRYILSTSFDSVGQPTQLEEIAPYISVEGESPESLFDLVEGTGMEQGDLDLGSYQVRPANFENNTGSTAGGGSGNPPFDPSDPVAAATALQTLSTMDPSDPLYQDYIDTLNEALSLGTIDDSGFEAAGLTNYNGTWMRGSQATAAYAEDASNLLTSGTAWQDLSPEQQAGYANTYPSQAVTIGGESALNAMGPSNLTEELVSGYVNNAGTWTSPTVNSGSISPTTLSSQSQSWHGWNQPFPVVRINDPLQPAEIIGYVTPNASWSSGISFDPQLQVQTTNEPTPFNIVYNTSLQPNVIGVTLSGSPTVSIGGGNTGGSLFGGGLGGGTVTNTNQWSGVTFNSSTGGTIMVIAP